jgi:hypothetical protein
METQVVLVVVEQARVPWEEEHLVLVAQGYRDKALAVAMVGVLLITLPRQEVAAVRAASEETAVIRPLRITLSVTVERVVARA